MFVSLTLFGRSLLLLSLEIVANVVCLAVAAHFHAIIGLAILAWVSTQSDHPTSIRLTRVPVDNRLEARSRCGPHQVVPTNSVVHSAIDNAARTLINHGRVAITCGLFFSLGHSTIVIVVNVALVISTSIYNKLGGVGNVGSILGTAISGSFLFVVGLANSVILCKILHRRRQARRKQDSERGETPTSSENMLMMRLLGPLVNFVNRPWKMYPVGVLFGLGFDTASSIALLAVSAIARGGGDGPRILPSNVIILPLLFTAGMTLVDSLDSILMFYSYTEFTDHSWRIFEPSDSPSETRDVRMMGPRESLTGQGPVQANSVTTTEVVPVNQSPSAINTECKPEHDGDRNATRSVVERSAMSTLSITLTTMSILLAFTMSLIEIMGLVGANCGECRVAASSHDGGGLLGHWWRFWAKANDNYGYIGAGIVGLLVVVVGGWYIVKWLYSTFANTRRR